MELQEEVEKNEQRIKYEEEKYEAELNVVFFIKKRYKIS